MAKKKLEDLTIGEAKKRLDKSLQEYLDLCDLFGKTASTNKLNSESGVAQSSVGQYVLVRSRNEGINAGKVVAADETGIVLEDARRLWYHKPAVKSESWYEGIANHGISSDTKISGAVGRKIIIENYSVTVCNSDSEQSIRSAASHAQN